ncbi:hypothetical protein HK098_006892 [Nowakowskiella sp. JEL0407]|nr:hypothetical protein HK098_006892 [Nowakowskiella sp. JEL0407]
MIKTTTEKVMTYTILLITILFQFTVIPMFVIYFPTGLYGIQPPNTIAGKKYPLTGAAFFPDSIITASLVYILITFVLFQVAPFMGSCYVLLKYGVNPERGNVERDSEKFKAESKLDKKDLKKTYTNQLLHRCLSDPNGAPTVLIVMPVYNEDPDALFNAVLSVTRANYLKSCMHLFVSFDDESISELYLRLLEKMGVFDHAAEIDTASVLEEKTPMELKAEQQFHNLKKVLSDGSIAYDIPTNFTLTFEGVCVTICRFPHNGKRATQAKTFKLMNKMYGQKGSDTERTFVLYIDSDIILEKNAIYEFARSMELEPDRVAYTGYITVRTSIAPSNFLVAYQDAEYLHSQLIHRSFESVLGGVVCLPGALTMVRLRALKEVAPHYFTRLDTRKTLDYHRFHLGEDRYMTHLLMEVATNKPKQQARRLIDRKRRAAGKSPRKWSKPSNAFTIGLCTAARCKTEAPDTWQKLLKQRRRWFLGAIANEIFMLTAPLLWRHTPLLMASKLWDFASRSMIFYVTLFNIILNSTIYPRLQATLDAQDNDIKNFRFQVASTPVSEAHEREFELFDFFFPTSESGLVKPLAIFLGPMLMKWLVLICIGIILRRWRMAVLFPVVSVLQPAFGMAYTIYSLKTYAVRSWGGPRTDKGGEENPKEALERIWRQLRVPDPDEEADMEREGRELEDYENIYINGYTNYSAKNLPLEDDEDAIDVVLDMQHPPPPIAMRQKTIRFSEKPHRIVPAIEIHNPESKGSSPALSSAPSPKEKRTSGLFNWFTKDHRKSGTSQSTPRYSLKFINLRPLDEDEKTTLYNRTLERNYSQRSRRTNFSTAKTSYAGSLSRPHHVINPQYTISTSSLSSSYKVKTHMNGSGSDSNGSSKKDFITSKLKDGSIVSDTRSTLEIDLGDQWTGSDESNRSVSNKSITFSDSEKIAINLSPE